MNPCSVETDAPNQNAPESLQTYLETYLLENYALHPTHCTHTATSPELGDCVLVYVYSSWWSRPGDRPAIKYMI